MSVTFKIKNSIHHMLKHPWSCYGSFLGYMSYDKNRNIQSLCQLQQDTGGLPYLGNTSRCGRYLSNGHGLYRINDNDLWAFFLNDIFNSIQICLTKQLQMICKFAKSRCPEFDLPQGFLPGYIQHFFPCCCQPLADLQKQCGLSDSGITAYQDQRSLHDTAAKNSVKLPNSTACPLFLRQ